ncbi:MAG: hypothetical protein WBB21_14315 [Saprospiraceae bacterium]
MKFLNVLLCVILSQVLIAQLPNTSLFSLQIENSKDSNWIIRKVEFLSNFNPASYNNQPFLVNEDLMLASIKLKTSDNTEIYKFDLQKKSYSNLTKSSASEYSPRCSSALLNSFTCVQVPRDDTSKQDLIQMNLETGNIDKYIFKNKGKIGYYRHIKDKEWACYLVDQPHILGICNEDRSTKKIFASSIGRCFEIMNGREIIFVHKITDELWQLKSYNILTEKSNLLATMPKGTEDFVLDEYNQVICASGSKLLRLNRPQGWHVLVDLLPLNIDKITRLALYKNRIILVSLN